MTRRDMGCIGLALVILAIIGSVIYYRVMPGVELARKAPGVPILENSDPLPGQPAFPFPENRKTPYSIINCPVTKETVVAVDKILSELEADHIAQTRFFCMPGPISEPATYAARALRYLALGLPDGPRKDNGAIGLIVYTKNDLKVYFSPGLGVTKFSAIQLEPVFRDAADVSKEKGIDAALVSLATGYNTVAREDYQPWNPEKPNYGHDPKEASSDLFQTGINLAIKYYYFALPLEILLGLLMVLGLNTFDLSIWVAILPLRLLYYVALFGGGGSSSSDEGKSGSGSGRTKRAF